MSIGKKRREAKRQAQNIPQPDDVKELETLQELSEEETPEGPILEEVVLPEGEDVPVGQPVDPLPEEEDDGVKVFYAGEIVDEEEVVELEPCDDELVDAPPLYDDGAVEVFEVDPITDDEDENYQLPKFINLPNLIDYMLSLGLTKKMKINMAMLLAMAYDKFKNKKEEKMLLLKCMYKLLLSISQK